MARSKLGCGFSWISLLCVVLLSACGSGSSKGSAPTLSLSFGMKQAQLRWTPVSGTTYYRVLASPDSTSAFRQVGADQTANISTQPLALHKQFNARYRVQACNSGGCTDSNIVNVASQLTQAVGYFKASNTGNNDYFGGNIALSADGNTLAVGAFGEDSSATSINGKQGDNSASDSGAVYVFSRTGSTWTQQAYVKASNTGVDDEFGTSVALSADGNTLAVGAFREGSSATGLNDNQDNNSATDSGAVYVFSRSGSTWTQQAYVKASNTGAGDSFGYGIALSADGNTLAVGAHREGNSATGMSSNQAENSALASGAVYVFNRSGSTWTQQAYLKASNSGAGDYFGGSVALSVDGNTLAVGANQEDSNATGMNGKQSNNSAEASGAVYIFNRSGSSWTQQAYVKASNSGADKYFGISVALSAAGSTLAVGAPYEANNATGINGNQGNNGAGRSGAVYLY